MNEEQYCYEALRRLQEEYQRAAQPYLDRLVAIKSIQLGPMFLVQPSQLTPEILSILKDQKP